MKEPNYKRPTNNRKASNLPQKAPRNPKMASHLKPAMKPTQKMERTMKTTKPITIKRMKRPATMTMMAISLKTVSSLHRKTLRTPKMASFQTTMSCLKPVIKSLKRMKRTLQRTKKPAVTARSLKKATSLRQKVPRSPKTASFQTMVKSLRPATKSVTTMKKTAKRTERARMTTKSLKAAINLHQQVLKNPKTASFQMMESSLRPVVQSLITTKRMKSTEPIMMKQTELTMMKRTKRPAMRAMMARNLKEVRGSQGIRRPKVARHPKTTGTSWIAKNLRRKEALFAS